ncbi:MAG: PAS domain-containing protein, partial [Bacteroidota bacterium]
MEDLILPEKDKWALLDQIERCREEKANQFVSFLSKKVVLEYVSKSLIILHAEQAETDQYHSHFAKSPHPIVVCNRKGKIEWANQQALKGLPSEGMVKHLFEEDDLIGLALERSINKNIPLQLDLILTQGKTPVKVLFVPEPFQGKVRLEIQRGEEVKTGNHKLLDAVVESSSDAICCVLEGQILLSNDSFKEMFPYELTSLEELVHRTAGRWFNQDKERPLGVGQIPFLNQNELDKEEEFELQLNYTEEKFMPLEISGASITVDQQQVQIWRFKDVSHRYSIQRKLEKANNNLEHFVRATAHDLKSPVTNMVNLFRLCDQLEDTSKKELIYDKLKASVGKLDDLLGGLMEMVDAQTNRELTVEQLSFGGVLEFLQEEFKTDI